MLTLRQIEVIRAIMIAGTVKGAADLLGVSAPGISRVMKHTESQLGLSLFSRTHGRYTPTEEARDIFSQISEVYNSVDNLQELIASLKVGGGRTAGFAAVPSIAHHVFPAAVKSVRADFPNLKLRLNTLKIEEAIDYLLLQRGEMVALSYKLDHPGLLMVPLYRGTLKALVPADHPLAAKDAISVHDLAREPMIGIESDDPYGRILMEPFLAENIDIDLSISVRTGHTTASLVSQGLGVGVTDELSIAGPTIHPGIAVRPIAEPTVFRTYAAFNAQVPRSAFADRMVTYLKQEMEAVKLP
ncbi:hypothetical protein BVC71_08890 [Marivivens niveibacter]|uniref:HTH lysR-type domain-containing protein n=1 Tax=Marivivens niveibacter TaxID=1930667 RepID=A0A251WXI4_9RHOB|nr:LysR family transcriptional regulator [Marivivens niveibacter]OUD08828.1 hypothetical protein BVC71_08890 [Marivivens niveibacter]